jgi:hypothetical protein
MTPIKSNGAFYDYLSDLDKCRLDPKQLEVSPRRFNRNFLIEVLNKNGTALRYLDKSFLKDRELVLIGVQKLSHRSDLAKLRNQRHFPTLWDHGSQLIKDRVTTMEELTRVLGSSPG